MESRPWWQRDGYIFWVLLLFFPVGVFLMWKYARWPMWGKLLSTGLAVLVGLMILGPTAGDENTDGGEAASNAADTSTVQPPTSPTATATEQLTPTPLVGTPTAEPTPLVGTPTAEPTPAEKRTPVYNPSNPSPAYRLALLSFSCTTSSSSRYNTCEGAVTNLTNQSLRNIVAVVTWVDSNGTPQRSDDALIDFNPILAGQTSTWSTIGRANPGLTDSYLNFKELSGGTILTRNDR